MLRSRVVVQKDNTLALSRSEISLCPSIAATSGIDLKHSDMMNLVHQRAEPRGPLGIRLITEHIRFEVRVVDVGHDGGNAGLVRRHDYLCHDDFIH
jgi:hypothetical protein